MKVYVITHKIFNSKELRNNDSYPILLVGAKNGNKGLQYYLNDNTKENISGKNKNFCELTGQYWIWKNSQEDIVGLVHYRRYFSLSKKSKSLNSILPAHTIRNILSSNDIILPKRNPFIFEGKTAAQFFGDVHDPLVWTLTRDIIKESYPSYIQDFDWFSSQKSGYVYNMVITKKELFDQYSKWLFDILFKLEKQIDISNYDAYNQRMFGFVSERLINVWVHHMKLKVYECPVMETENKKMTQRVRLWLKKIYLTKKGKL